MTYSGDGQYLAVVGVDTNIYIVRLSYCLFRCNFGFLFAQ